MSAVNSIAGGIWDLLPSRQNSLGVYNLELVLKTNPAKTDELLNLILTGCTPNGETENEYATLFRDLFVFYADMVLGREKMQPIVAILSQEGATKLAERAARLLAPQGAAEAQPLDIRKDLHNSFNLLDGIREIASRFGYPTLTTEPLSLAISANSWNTSTAEMIKAIRRLVRSATKLVHSQKFSDFSPNLILPIALRQQVNLVIASRDGEATQYLQVPAVVEYPQVGVTSTVLPWPSHTQDAALYVMLAVCDIIRGVAAAHRRRIVIGNCGRIQIVRRDVASNSAQGSATRACGSLFAIVVTPSLSRAWEVHGPWVSPDGASSATYAGDVWLTGQLILELVTAAEKLMRERRLDTDIARVRQFVNPILKLCLERDAANCTTSENLETLLNLDVLLATLLQDDADLKCVPRVELASGSRHQSDDASNPIQSTAPPTLQTEFTFVAGDKTIFPREKQSTNKTETGALVPVGGVMTGTGKFLLQSSGLAETAGAAMSTRVAVKSVPADLDPAFEETQFQELRSRLLEYQHPNVVRYADVAYSRATRIATFFMALFNANSLEDWIKKFDGSLPHDMAASFAKAVGAQLLLGLCYLHEVQKSAHGNMCPSNILLDSEGRVALNDYSAVREVVGASTATRAMQADDVKAVARVMFTIASLQRWDATGLFSISMVDDRSVPSLSLRNMIENMLSKQLTAAELLQDVCMNELPTPGSQQLPPMFERSLELEGALKEQVKSAPETLSGELAVWRNFETSSTMSQVLKLAVRYAFCKRHAGMISNAAEFIKSTLVPMLQHRKAVASSASEWTVKKVIKSNVEYVMFGKSIQQRFKLSSETEVGVVKLLELKLEDASAHALRRAVTIMERSHHPNIVRMLAATRQGQMVHIICEAAEFGSLQHVLQHLPEDKKLNLMLGVICQLLNGLMYLHEKLCVAHRDVTIDHVLVHADGRVKLCGFGAGGKVQPNAPADMVQLSDMLGKILQNIPAARENKELMTFVTNLPKMRPHSALKDKIMSDYYSEDIQDEAFKKLLAELKEPGIYGSGPEEELKSWRAFDEKNPTSELRHAIRGKMKDVTLRRELRAVIAVREAVHYASSPFKE